MNNNMEAWKGKAGLDKSKKLGVTGVCVWISGRWAGDQEVWKVREDICRLGVEFWFASLAMGDSGVLKQNSDVIIHIEVYRWD